MTSTMKRQDKRYSVDEGDRHTQGRHERVYTLNVDEIEPTPSLRSKDSRSEVVVGGPRPGPHALYQHPRPGFAAGQRPTAVGGQNSHLVTALDKTLSQFLGMYFGSANFGGIARRNHQNGERRDGGIDGLVAR